MCVRVRVCTGVCVYVMCVCDVCVCVRVCTGVRVYVMCVCESVLCGNLPGM